MSENIEASCNENGLLILKIDLSKTGTKLGSGKSMVKATARGYKSIRDLCGDAPEEFANIKIGINIYEKVKE